MVGRDGRYTKLELSSMDNELKNRIKNDVNLCFELTEKIRPTPLIHLMPCIAQSHKQEIWSRDVNKGQQEAARMFLEEVPPMYTNWAIEFLDALWHVEQKDLARKLWPNYIPPEATDDNNDNDDLCDRGSGNEPRNNPFAPMCLRGQPMGNLLTCEQLQSDDAETRPKSAVGADTSRPLFQDDSQRLQDSETFAAFSPQVRSESYPDESDTSVRASQPSQFVERTIPLQESQHNASCDQSSMPTQLSTQLPYQTKVSSSSKSPILKQAVAGGSGSLSRNIRDSAIEQRISQQHAEQPNLSLYKAQAGGDAQMSTEISNFETASFPYQNVRDAPSSNSSESDRSASDTMDKRYLQNHRHVNTEIHAKAQSPPNAQTREVPDGEVAGSTSGEQRASKVTNRADTNSALQTANNSYSDTAAEEDRNQVTRHSQNVDQISNATTRASRQPLAHSPSVEAPESKAATTAFDGSRSSEAEKPFDQITAPEDVNNEATNESTEDSYVDGNRSILLKTLFHSFQHYTSW